MKKIFIAFLLAAGTLFWSGCDSLDLGPIELTIMAPGTFGPMPHK